MSNIFKFQNLCPPFGVNFSLLINLSRSPWTRLYCCSTFLRWVRVHYVRVCVFEKSIFPIAFCHHLRPSCPARSTIMRRASEASLFFLGFPRKKKPLHNGSYEHRAPKIKNQTLFCTRDVCVRRCLCVIQHRSWPLRSTILNAHGTNASLDGLCTRTHTCLLYTSDAADE